MRAAFCDPAGGSGADSMTLAWAESTDKKVTLLGLVEKKPPFSPRACVEEFAEILKKQGFTRVTGDRFSGGWVVEAFHEHDVHYEVSETTKSEIYQAFLVLANSGQVQIPLHSKLIAQLQRLERRVIRSGKESVDHSVGGHDDYSNAAAGALVLASAGLRPHREPHITILNIVESRPIPESVWNRPPSYDPFSNEGVSGRSLPRIASFGCPTTIRSSS